VEDDKADVKQGTKIYLEHCVTKARLLLGYLKAMQALGVVPKNVGGKAITEWHFVSPTQGLLTVCNLAQQ
jgi:hypothetical protein